MNTTLLCLCFILFVCCSGLSADNLGKLAAGMLTRAITSGSCVDDNLQDQVNIITSGVIDSTAAGLCQLAFLISCLQLIIFMSLARGVSQVCCAPLTLHTKTAIYVAELMTRVSGTGQLHTEWIGQTQVLLTL